MNVRFRFALLFALLCLLFAGAAAQAQTPAAAAPARVARTPLYDASKETTIEGTVSSVVTTPTKGMIPGAHLMVATPTGTIDAPLGRYVMQGPRAAVFTPGERVSIVGVPAVFANQHIFLARTVQGAGKTYQVRNQRGFLVQTATPVSARSKTLTLQGGAR